MGQRGRKSTEAVAVATFAVPAAVERPDAPYTLTDEQADIWTRIVSARPADHFTPETWGDLANYCRHEAASNRVSQLIQQYEQSGDAFCAQDYDALLKMQERETRAMASLAVRLRIAPSASASKNKDLSVTSAQKPWLKKGRG